MNAEAVLLWMSARRAGSWQQFRSAVEALDRQVEGEEGPAEDDVERGGLPNYQQMRLALERLAHAEFFTHGCEDGWRIAPPVLAVCEWKQRWKGVFCGARSPRLLAALQIAAGENGVGLHTENANGQPPIIRIVGTPEALMSLAAKTGVGLQANASMAILSCLPAVDDARYLRPAVLPMGADWQIDRFDPQTRSWRAFSRDEAAVSINRLFRFVLGYERHHFLTLGGRLWELRGPGPGQIGKYLVLRRCRRRVLRYFPETGELVVPASCRPPLLIERALALCTGSLPTFEPLGSLLSYRDIPDGVARIVAALLRQEFNS
jgi:hypothetical protein